MKVLLLSTYELGHQPFGVASPAAWLRRDGHGVICADLARESLAREAVTWAGLIGLYLPMHTATRLAVRALRRIRVLNPAAHLCGYGVYAPANEALLRELGVQSILGGEFEQPLADLARRLDTGPDGAGGTLVSMARQEFLVPDRSGLPRLQAYAQLNAGGRRRTVGYTEASRGCKHLCRHCPIVPVYNGAFRIVQRPVVLEDIRRQVQAGAEHITFGDPDFFNGPGHAIPLVEELHAEFPALGYDVTIKIEHLLKHRDLLPVLRQTGCLFVTSAVESIDDSVLQRLDKGHTRDDFFAAVRLMREAGLTLAPTFVPFHPWTTRDGYRDLLRAIVELDLVEQTAPIQLAIRLLIPQRSRLLELEEVRRLAGPFDANALAHPWRHPDPWLEGLCVSIQEMIHKEERKGASRSAIFARIWDLAENGPLPENYHLVSRAAIPFLTEPWYC